MSSQSPSHVSLVLTLKKSTEKFEPHARIHHIPHPCHYGDVDLCSSIMSHATRVLYPSPVRIKNTNLLNIMYTLVATCMILGQFRV